MTIHYINLLITYLLLTVADGQGGHVHQLLWAMLPRVLTLPSKPNYVALQIHRYRIPLWSPISRAMYYRHTLTYLYLYCFNTIKSLHENLQYDNGFAKQALQWIPHGLWRKRDLEKEMWTVGYRSRAGGRWRRHHRTELNMGTNRDE